MRSWKNIVLTNPDGIPEGLYNLFQSYSNGIILNSNANKNGEFEWMTAFGNSSEYQISNSENPFEELHEFLSKNQNWVFGHFNYDLKNSLENLHSNHHSGIDFSELHFIIPEIIAIKKSDFSCSFSNENKEIEFQKALGEKSKNTSKETQIILTPRTSKTEYLKNVESLLQHIHRGDIYEINYCIEFFSENVFIDPVSLFLKLNALTDAPFSALYKDGDQWLICASPERFIQKKGNKIISQPIKGTRPRGKTNEEDDILKKDLLNDKKEQSENVMIVDLVRNDLSRSAKKGSVKVEELFGIHSFKNVHQMISTVTCELHENVNPIDAIKNAFPMGSMTGAPKVRAMDLIEDFENMKRGLYSGAIGYFTPQMDFDFNVVIRSIQYNSKTGYLSLMVGSAITALSDPEKEYAECLVKAETLFQALGAEKINN
ncbi:MAG: anthranilate synthase component I family protein [Bacteroidetes bacterium]|nr:anthranilate synthase component I family protein [Bacteroidota bacterium]